MIHFRSTFFVSHEYTNYNFVQHLYQAGHDIASHTVNHTSSSSVYEEVAAEVRNKINDDVKIYRSDSNTYIF